MLVFLLVAFVVVVVVVVVVSREGSIFAVVGRLRAKSARRLERWFWERGELWEERERRL